MSSFMLQMEKAPLLFYFLLGSEVERSKVTLAKLG